MRLFPETRIHRGVEFFEPAARLGDAGHRGMRIGKHHMDEAVALILRFARAPGAVAERDHPGISPGTRIAMHVAQEAQAMPDRAVEAIGLERARRHREGDHHARRTDQRALVRIAQRAVERVVVEETAARVDTAGVQEAGHPGDVVAQERRGTEIGNGHRTRMFLPRPRTAQGLPRIANRRTLGVLD